MAELIKKYPSPISELTRLAQAVHETGNFKSDIFKNANNSFGIKASAPWNGETYNAKTGEHFDGKDVIIRDNFRKYKTAEDSVADQALFFVSTDHRKNVAYKEAIEAPNYIEEGKALMGPGKYATDVPSANSIGYAAKLLRTIENYGLKNYGMKESASLKDIEVNKETPKEESKGEDKNMAKLRTPIKKITLVNSFARNTNKPKYIVIHYIGAAGQALANANYFYNVNRNASAHYFIDKNVTYQVVEEDAGAWHVG